MKIKVQAIGDISEKSLATADGSRKGKTAVLHSTDKAIREHSPCQENHCRHQHCHGP